MPPSWVRTKICYQRVCCFAQSHHKSINSSWRRIYRAIHQDVTFKRILSNSEGNRDDIYSFGKKYKWIFPWKRDPALETYLKKVKDGIYCTLDKNGSKYWPYDNFTNIERKDLLYRELGSVLSLINQQTKVMPLWQCRDRTNASK